MVCLYAQGTLPSLSAPENPLSARQVWRMKRFRYTGREGRQKLECLFQKSGQWKERRHGRRENPRGVKELGVCRSYKERIHSVSLLCQVYLEYSQSKQCNYFGFTLCHGVVRPEVPTPQGLCRLADELLCFPRGCGSSERKGHADFSEDSRKLPLPLGLCVVSLSESLSWGHPQQDIPVLVSGFG